MRKQQEKRILEVIDELCEQLSGLCELSGVYSATSALFPVGLGSAASLF